ncbi:MAG: EutN/CcmL family microcompartment protein [Candidatus Muirbacterium halophilum]|nr:EutN/CcmL family microcompartment protein [Candidatus Muirbacterium halophilum]MCK9475292.1 EutN/CcmL family microcompartment protein [Candidatus Muirbacterium halophilum]
MNIGKVTGNIVSSHKYPGFTGTKLMLLQPVDSMYKNAGNIIIATDSVGAGNGEYVIYITSSEACIPFVDVVKYIPTDATIVGIIDKIDIMQES